MTRYLDDINVISAIAPTAAVKRAELIKWMDMHSPDLFLSAVAIAEIAEGIAKAKRESRSEKRPICQLGYERCCTVHGSI